MRWQDSSLLTPNSGAISVAPLSALNWWDQTAFNFTVLVQDADPLYPIVVSMNITVKLIQVNTVNIQSFYIAAATVPSVAMNVSGSGSLQVSFGSRGLSTPLLYIVGTGFGRTARRLQIEGGTTVVTAKFNGGKYTATCTVASANTLLVCSVPAGAGTGHKWVVTIDTLWSATSTATTGYYQPTIFSLYKSGGIIGNNATQTITTRGTDLVLVTGDNFGPAGSVILLAYGRMTNSLYEHTFGSAGACTIVTAHTAVSCPTTQGVGADLKWSLQSESQAGPDFSGSPVRYTTPQITSVTAPVLATSGGQSKAIVVQGSDFGPLGLSSSDLGVWYAVDFTNNFYTQFQAATCKVTVAHTTVTCDSVAGVGTGLSSKIRVGGQLSPASTDLMSYKLPILTALSGAGKHHALTIGGQEVVLSGSSFGPVSPLFGNGTIMPIDLQPVAYYSSDVSNSYIAAACRVVVPDVTIICNTVPGVGFDLKWQVQVGEQLSQVLEDDVSDYHPPVVASYSGPGAVDAQTWGDESVVIYGTNFGPNGNALTSVTYRSGNDTAFIAQNCSLTVPHTTIVCFTVVGAGNNLKWSVTIGGQASVTPTTSYGIPIVDWFGGAAIDASTDGGDVITIAGRYFSIEEFLGTVSFGRTGSEYPSIVCNVSVDHLELTCVLPPGVGRANRWYVSVGNQISALSNVSTSYAPPIIASASRLNSTTDAKLGIVPVTIIIDGTDFAVRVPSAVLHVRINNLNLDRPAQDLIDEHWADMLAGRSGVPEVATWISSLTYLYTTTLTSPLLSKSQHRVSVDIPAGFGPSAELFVMAGGVPSNVLTYQYLPPVITNIAADRQNMTVGYLRVFVEGQSFCSGEDNCGRVFINNETYSPVFWGHTQLMFIAPDPATTGEPTMIHVEVGGVASNFMSFVRPTPNIDALLGQGDWSSMDTRGGQPFFIAGVKDIVGINDTVDVLIGGRLCTDRWGYIDNGLPLDNPEAAFTLRCTTPAGVGSDLPIIMKYLDTSSRDDSNFRLNYAPPTISVAHQVYVSTVAQAAAIQSGDLPLPDLSRNFSIAGGIPTIGGVVILDGINFGEAWLGQGNLFDALGFSIMGLMSQNHTQLVAVVPPGDGAVHGFQFSVAFQTSNVLPFAYTPPSVNSVSPNHGPTLGGTILTITGKNFGTSVPSVYVGGRPCALVTPFVVSVNHTQIQCIAPKGQGKQLQVVVSVNGQSSSYSPAVWSYDPPQVSSISPNHGPTSGRVLGDLKADGVHRLEGARVIQVIRGTNLGVSGMLAYVPQDSSDVLSAVANVTQADILSWNDTAIVYYMPEGYGDSLFVSVFVDQPCIGITEFSYDIPAVMAVTRYDMTVEQCHPFQQCFTFGNDTRCRMVPAGCYDTRGGYSLEIVGASFGIQAVLFPYTIIYVGAHLCTTPQNTALRTLLSHDRLICTVPTGVGDNLPVTVGLGRRTSQISNISRFTYDPPIVTVISPNTPDALGRQSMTLRGKNFGFESTPLLITVDDVPCTTSEWLNDGQLSCLPPAEVVGAKNFSIVVANRTTPYTFFDVEEALVYQCVKDEYGLDGEVCLKCPQGATCPGGERFVDRVNATAGFWRLNKTVDDSLAVMFCDAPRRQTRAVCPVFLPCGPPEACLQDNVCADGYEGERCAYCLAGKYYRVNGKCVKCPDNLYVLYVGLAVLMLAVVAFAYFLNRKNISLALIAIGIDYAQVMSMFSRTNIKWPPMLTQLFQILSAFNLNLEITAPECLNPGIQFWQKWFFIEGTLSWFIAVL
jgi:hypothetical protein